MTHCARCGRDLKASGYDLAILPGKDKRLPVCRDQYSCDDVRCRTKVVRKSVAKQKKIKNKEVPQVVRANRRYVI
jgi:hypothetical protein